MMMAKTLAVTLFATVSQAPVYNWQGAEISLGDDSLWTQANGSPLNDSPNGVGPRSSIFGAASKKTIAIAPRSSVFNLGRRIELLGDAKIILGDGTPGSRVTLQLDSTSNGETAMFAPSETNNPNIDYNCHLNWGTSGGIASTPPSTDDAVNFDSTVATMVQIPRGSAAGSITVARQRVSDCNELNGIDMGFTVLDFAGSCSQSLQFGGSSSPSSTCGGFIEVTDSQGNTVQIYTNGSLAGQAFTVGQDGTLTNSTDRIDVSDNTDGNGNPIYTLDGSTVGGSEASSGSDSGDSGSMIIIIVIVVAVLIIALIIAVVVVKVKSAGKAGGSSDRGIVSFENPMYDDVTTVDAGGAQDNGMYDEPAMANDSSGYMDVPAGGGDGKSGYMDVPAGSGDAGYMDVPADDAAGFGTGYMDVSPNADDDDDDGDI